MLGALKDNESDMNIDEPKDRLTIAFKVVAFCLQVSRYMICIATAPLGHLPSVLKSDLFGTAF